MSAVSSTERLDPVSQIQQFCSSVGSLLNALTESTDSAFRRVHVMKKDQNGNFKFYNIKDKDTGETKRVGILSYVEDIKTGEMRLDEPNHVVAMKCAFLVLGIPFYTVGRMAWYAFKTPVEITKVAVNTVVKAGQHIILGRLYESSVEMRNGFSEVSEMFGEGIFEIIKAPIFAVGAELASIYGIFKPQHGRKFESIIENAWQQGASHKEDFRNIPPRDGENCFQAFVKDVATSRPFYLAHCFQSRGNVNDANVVVIQRSSL